MWREDHVAESRTSLTLPITRRRFIEVGKAAAGLVVASAVLQACGGTAASSPTAGSQPASAKPSPGGTSPVASTSGERAAQLTPVTNAAKVPATWDEMLAAAKTEGKV